MKNAEKSLLLRRNMEKRANFGSKMGALLASAGSAVGLANVWRFPMEVGEHGGAAFILVYVLCVLLIGMPVMISEFIIGRHTHSNGVDAYRRLAPRSGWVAQGYLGVFVSWFILCYYSVVAGWTFRYLLTSLSGRLTRIGDSAAYFETFTSGVGGPLLFTFLALLITHAIVTRGVQKGIERFSKVMMPLLLLLVLFLGIYSLFMSGAHEALVFLFHPDFSKVTADTVLSAMGQAFFSLSLGMGCLTTYASYFSSSTNLSRTAVSVAGIDTLVAVLSGLIIFPAVFTIGGSVSGSGPGLAFITLPNVFRIAFVDAPWLGILFAALFYLLLVLSALTSTISIHETATAFFHDHGLSRRASARIVTAVCMVFGTLCALSFGVLKNVKPFFGMTFFDFFDFFSAKFILPVSGLLISLFVGWRLDKKLVRDEFSNHGALATPLFGLLRFLLRWFVPIAILLVFLNELGLLSR